MTRSISRLAGWVVVLIGASTTAGCLEFTEHPTTTVLDRRPLPPYVRRVAALDRVVVEPAWEGETLVLRAMTERVSVAYEAERQIVDQATIREPVSWVPVIVHGTLAAVALGVIAGTEISKRDCRPTDDTCAWAQTLFIEVPAGAVAIAMTALLVGDLPAIVDTHKKAVWDVPTGAMTKRSEKVPLAGARITLRFQDGEEIHATTDDDGRARLDMPGGRAASRARAALLVGGVHVRDVEIGARTSEDVGER